MQITAYHTTDAEFDAFDAARLGEYTDRNATEDAARELARLGIWFADRDLRQDLCADHCLTCEIEMANPYTTTFALLWDEMEQGGAAAFRAALESDGYDGIIVEDGEFGGREYVALDADAITITARA